MSCCTGNTCSVGAQGAARPLLPEPPVNSCCQPNKKGCSSTAAAPSTCADNRADLATDKCNANSDISITIDDTLTDGTPSDWITLRLTVTGMTCTSCEKALMAAMQALPHAKPVAVSIFNNMASLVYDPSSTSPGTLVDLLAKTTNFQFTVEHVAASNVARFIIAAGAGSIRLDADAILHALQMQPGVTNCRLEGDASLNKHLLVITFDPDRTGPRTLLSFLASLGLQADLHKEAGSQDRTGDEILFWARRLALSTVLCVPVLVFAYGIPDVAANVTVVHELHLWTLLMAVLVTPIQLYAAWPIHYAAWTSLLRSRRVEMDMLVSLSTSVAYIYSIAVTAVLAALPGTRLEVFYETVALLVTLVVLGRYVTVLARGRAANAIAALRGLQPTRARLVVKMDGDLGGEEVQEIDVDLLQRGDVVVVLPSSCIPADGIVVKGKADADESMITGESLPVTKEAGCSVVGGSIISGGVLTIRITHVPTEGILSNMQRLVQEAQSSRAPVQELADRIASVFTPAVVVIAAVVFFTWLGIGLKNGERAEGQPAGVEALLYAIAVLVVSCPCAVGLAVPTVIVIAAGVAARHGVLFRNGASLESAATIDTVVFDKTGTLTTGTFGVVHEVYSGGDDSAADVRAAIVAVAAASEHPLARAVAEHVSSAGVPPTAAPGNVADEIVPRLGLGIEGRVAGAVVRVGRPAWVAKNGFTARLQDALSRIQRDGCSVVAVSVNSVPVAVYGLRDTMRADAKEAIARLLSSNIDVHVLSGDHAAAVQRLAHELGIQDGNVAGGCLPADKLARIQDLQRAGQRVAFVGDGSNDAPALAQAHVGIAFGSGTDLALNTADVVLLRPQTIDVINVLRMARRARSTVIANFSWAFIYNVGAILLAAGVFVSLNNVRIPPALAGLGELVSVLPVIAFSMTLHRIRWIRGSV